MIEEKDGDVDRLQDDRMEHFDNVFNLSATR